MANPISTQPGAAKGPLLKATGPAGNTSTGGGNPSGTAYTLVGGATFTAHPDDVAWFLSTGAATVVSAGSNSVVPGQLLLMKNPAGTGCSWGGKSYAVDGSQRVAVPFEAAADLQAMGYVALGQIAAP